ncbi:MAG TPA: NlpC/P60 family protein, partial [Thermoleophilia bacterium]|nr:NlpC/P60 family protein [Thermoleophilia bacterium]
MTGRRLAATILFIATALLLLAPASPSLATPSLSTRARAIQRQLDALYMRVDIVTDQYNAANDQLAKVRDEIRANERDIRIARYNLTVARHTLRSRVVALYKERPVDVLDVILATKSFDELLTQLDLLKKLGSSDAKVVDSIKTWKAEVARRGVKLEAQRATAAELVKQVSAKRALIRADIAKSERLLRGVKAQIARYEAARAAAARARALAAQASLTVPPRIVYDNSGPGHPEVIAIAQRYLGVPYVYGGSTPSGFDCSGFTMYCYAQLGIGLPHAASGQQRSVTAVSAPQPGDLVFFGYPAHHVGIYVGGGSMIHAPHTGAVVSYGSTAGA